MKQQLNVQIDLCVFEISDIVLHIIWLIFWYTKITEHGHVSITFVWKQSLTKLSTAMVLLHWHPSLKQTQSKWLHSCQVIFPGCPCWVSCWYLFQKMYIFTKQSIWICSGREMLWAVNGSELTSDEIPNSSIRVQVSSCELCGAAQISFLANCWAG